METIEESLNEAQNEYFTLFFDMMNMKEDLITEDKGYTYWWEELKERHLNVIHLADLHRFQSLNNAKEALEKAFTPHLKKMLEESKND